MKTLKITSAFILVLTLLQFSASAVIYPGQNVFMLPNVIKGQLVKAKQVGNQLVPVVNLPVISISGNQKNSVEYQKAIIVDGALLVVYNLPVINITSDRIFTGIIPAIYYKGEIIANYNLPVIDISANRSSDQILKSVNGSELIASVMLPEITITASRNDAPIVNAVSDGNKVVALVNLPVIEIISYSPITFKQSYHSRLIDNTNTQWFYVTLKNCGIDFSGERICEVVSQAKINSSSLLYSNIKQFITR